MENKSQPLVVEAKKSLDFLHVPIPTALRPSFLPLPDSLVMAYYLKSRLMY